MATQPVGVTSPNILPMDKLAIDDLRLFGRLVALGSLSAAARERDVPVSQVSRTLARIEKACGARLVHRSTHALALTPEGERFLESTRRIGREVDELQGEFANRVGEPSGVVRVAASSIVARYLLVPSLPALAARYPRLQVELEVADRLVDMARDAIDIAIRSGGVVPESLVARRISSLRRGLYASPAYVAAYGLPRHPDDLKEHRLIANSAVGSLNHWKFEIDGRLITLVADGHWRANDTAVAADLVLAGLGIGRLSTVVADGLRREGRVVPVLERQHVSEEAPISAVMALARHRLPKIRACVDHWAETFGAATAMTDPSSS